MSNSFNSSQIEVDDLLSQLQATPKQFIVKSNDPTTELPPVSCEPIKEEDLGQFVINQSQAIVMQTMAAFKDIKNIAVTSNDPDTISALADVVKSVTGALDSLNKIHLQNKKAQTAKEVAQIHAESRKKQMEQPTQQTNVLAIGTREQILKLMEDAVRSKPSNNTIIDAEVTDVPSTQ